VFGDEVVMTLDEADHQKLADDKKVLAGEKKGAIHAEQVEDVRS
jgi:hypothetical protein